MVYFRIGPLCQEDHFRCPHCGGVFQNEDGVYGKEFFFRSDLKKSIQPTEIIKESSLERQSEYDKPYTVTFCKDCTEKRLAIRNRWRLFYKYIIPGVTAAFFLWSIICRTSGNWFAILFMSAIYLIFFLFVGVLICMYVKSACNKSLGINARREMRRGAAIYGDWDFDISEYDLEDI